MTERPHPGCGGHAGLGAELRAVAVLAMDRLGPALDRVRADPPGTGPPSADTCVVCPVCAVIAVLRGERPELAVRLAEHAAGLLAVLQAALHEGDPTAGWSSPADEAAGSAEQAAPVRRVVQRIRVERPAPVHPC